MVFFAFTFVFGLILGVIGIVKPGLVIKWGPIEKRTRKMAAITYFGIAVVSFVIVGFTNDGSAAKQREQAAIEQQQKKADADAAAAAKKQAEQQQKQADAAAKEAEKKEKLQHTIKVLKVYTSNPNSANGVDLHIVWENTSDKTIKYCSFTAVPYNAVNDPVKCTIRNNSDYTGQVTGPIEPGQVSGEDRRWDCAWYNNTITRAELTGVRIEYMDGSTVNIEKKDIKSILQ